MDATPVTNAAFERFVKETGYVTIAERELNPADYPGVPPDKLVPGSAVFTPTGHPVAARRSACGGGATCQGANWKRPDGRGQPAQAAARITRRSTSRMTMRRRTPSGRESVCRPRRSSSSPRAEGSTATGTRGATS